MEEQNPRNAISPDVLADLHVILDCVAGGKPVPPEVAQRVREHTLRVRKEILAQHGIQDIGVRLIREARGELPES